MVLIILYGFFLFCLFFIIFERSRIYLFFNWYFIEDGKALQREIITLVFQSRKGQISQFEPSLYKPFKFYKSLLESIVVAHKKYGFKATESFAALNEEIQRDIELTEKWQGKFLSTLLQYGFCVFITESFMFYASYSMQLEFQQSTFLGVVFLQFLGTAFFLAGFKFIFERLLSPFQVLLKSLTFVSQQLSCQVPLSTIESSLEYTNLTNRKKEKKQIHEIKEEFVVLYKNLKYSGTTKVKDLEYLLEKAWFFYRDQFKKATIILTGYSSLLLLFFFVGAYLYSLWGLLDVFSDTLN